MKAALIYTQEIGYTPLVYDVSDKQLASKAWLALFKVLKENQEFIDLEYPSEDAKQLNFSFAMTEGERQRLMFKDADAGSAFAAYHLIRAMGYIASGQVKIIKVEQL